MSEKTSWKFYNNSEEAWDAMLLAIAEAKVSIDLEQYIFNYDSVGIMFINALKTKAKEGVRVRLFCDTVGSFALSRSGVSLALEEAGIQVKFFNPISPWHPNNESLWYFRDHRKLMVIDGLRGFTGGICLGEAMRTWRDTYVQIEGPVVAQMKESFEIMWTKAYYRFKFYIRPKHRKEHLPGATNAKDFSYLTNAPLPGKRHMYRELLRKVHSAKHYIYLTTPYLLPDSRLLRALKDAVRRGVEVRILVPLKTDVRIVDLGMATFFRDMLGHGIRIFRYNASLIHGKTGIIDGVWSTVGSLNLDNLSLRYNFEGNIVSGDKAFAFELERQFLEDLKLANELLLPDWQRRTLIQKILEMLVWPIRKFL